MKKFILLLVMLFFMGLSGYGQSVGCSKPGEVPCGRDHICKPRNECQGGPNPPPPGLVVPIDNNSYILFLAGIGLGIYFLVSKGNKSAAAD